MVSDTSDVVIADPKVLWTTYRTEMISQTGVTLFFIGNKIDKDTGDQINSPGVREEYEISKCHGNYLIPVGATGSMAEELYNELMTEISAGGTKYENCIDYYKALGDKTKSFDELRDIIIRLLHEISQ